MTPDVAKAALEEACQILRNVRSQRPRPSLDNKCIVSWNGLAISAFARAAQVFQEPGFLARARAAAEWIAREMVRVDPTDPATTTRVWRMWVNGSVSGEGQLHDYAFLIQGLLDLYEATFESRWLELAMALQESQIGQFWDTDAFGFFSSDPRAPNVLLKLKDGTVFDSLKPASSLALLLIHYRLRWCRAKW